MADQEGLRVAKAYMDITTNVDSAMAETNAKIRAAARDIEKGGNVAGESLDKGMADGVSKNTETQKAAALQIARIRESAAKQKAALVAIDADVSKAEARIKELEGKRGSGTKIDVDAEIGKAQAKIDALKAKRERVVLEVDVDKGSVDKATKSVDDAAEKMASSAQAKLSPLMWAGAFAGLPAAAAAGALGVGVAFAAVPGIFIGIAAAALKNNADIQASFGGLKEKVVTDTQGMASVLVGPLTAAATQAGEAFDRLKPQIQTAMLDSSPAVKQLTGTVTDFAESAMPGFVTAVRNSAAPLEGLRSLAGQTGVGITDMFTNMASGSQAAGTSLGTTGGIVRDLEGFLGSLLANLANGSTAVLPQFRAALGQVEGTVLTLTSAGMPALQGATSGFLGTIGGGLALVNTFASALGSWTQPLGSLGGTLFATNSVAKIFGTSLGETGFGLKAFASSVDEAGNKTSPFKTAVSGASGVLDKMKAGANSLASSGINPLGIVLVGGGLLLDAFGQAQQKAAEQAAAHKENVRQLTDAIRQDNGVMADSVQAVNAKALTDKNAASNLQAFGQTVGTATAAINGNRQAYDSLQNSADATLTTIAKSAGATDEQAQSFGKLAATSLETGKNYEQLRSEADALLTTSTASGDATIILNQAQRDQVNATINATGAVGEQLRAQRDAYTAYLASEGALAGLTAAQVAQRDATEKATEAIFAQQDAQLGYRGAVQTSDTALATYTKTSQNAKATEDQKAAALLAVENAFSAQEKAAGLAAQANSNATTAAGKQADGSRAQLRELVNLANGFQGQLPQSIQSTISRMSVADAQAAGLTVAINQTGDAVYRLPNGKEIKIYGDTEQAKAAVWDIQNKVDMLHGKTVTVAVSYADVTSPTTLTGRRQMYAQGGLINPSVGFAGGAFPTPTTANSLNGLAQVVEPGTFKWAGDAKVPEVFIPLDRTQRSMDLLAQANNIMAPQSSRAGGGTALAAPAATDRQRAPNITIHVNPPPGASSADTAALVSSELTWQLRTR